jgi:hypothetical protein
MTTGTSVANSHSDPPGSAVRGHDPPILDRHHGPAYELCRCSGYVDVGVRTVARVRRSPLVAPPGRRVSRPAVPPGSTATPTPQAFTVASWPALNTPASKSPPPRVAAVRCIPAPIRQVRVGGTVTGRQTLVSRVQLLVLLAEPAPSGSTGTFRHCRGCSHLVLRLQDSAAPASPALLRQASGGALASPPGS